MRRAGLQRKGRRGRRFWGGTADRSPVRVLEAAAAGRAANPPLRPQPRSPGLTSESLSLSNSVSTLSSARAAGGALAKDGSSSALRGLCSMLVRP